MSFTRPSKPGRNNGTSGQKVSSENTSQGIKISLKLNPPSFISHSHEHPIRTRAPDADGANDTDLSLSFDDESDPDVTEDVDIDDSLPTCRDHGTLPLQRGDRATQLHSSPSIRGITRNVANPLNISFTDSEKVTTAGLGDNTPKIRLKFGAGSASIGTSIQPSPTAPGTLPKIKLLTRGSVPFSSVHSGGSPVIDSEPKTTRDKKHKKKKKHKRKREGSSQEVTSLKEKFRSATSAQGTTGSSDSLPKVPSIKLNLNLSRPSKIDTTTTTLAPSLTKRIRLTAHAPPPVESPVDITSPSVTDSPLVTPTPEFSRIASSPPLSFGGERSPYTSFSNRTTQRIRKPSRKSLEAAVPSITGPVGQRWNELASPQNSSTPSQISDVLSAYRVNPTDSVQSSVPSAGEGDSDQSATTITKAPIRPKKRPGRKPTGFLKPVGGYTPIGRNLKVALTKLLDKIVKRDAYAFFLKPVDTKAIPDYLTVIKQPMDFGTMRQKVSTRRYRHIDEFAHDFNLVINNATTYNAPTTQYYRSARKIEEYGKLAIERMRRRIEKAMANAPPDAQDASVGEDIASPTPTSQAINSPPPAMTKTESNEPSIAPPENSFVRRVQDMQAQLANLLVQQGAEDILDVKRPPMATLPTALLNLNGGVSHATPIISRRGSQIDSEVGTPFPEATTELCSPLIMSRTNSSAFLLPTPTAQGSPRPSFGLPPSSIPGTTSSTATKRKQREAQLLQRVPSCDDGSLYLDGVRSYYGANWDEERNELDENPFWPWLVESVGTSGSGPASKRQKTEHALRPATYFDYGGYQSLGTSRPPTVPELHNANLPYVYLTMGDDFGASYLNSLVEFAHGCGDRAGDLIQDRLVELTDGAHTITERVWEILSEARLHPDPKPEIPGVYLRSDAQLDQLPFRMDPTFALRHSAEDIATLWTTELPSEIHQRFVEPVNVTLGEVNVTEELQRQLLLPLRRTFHQLLQCALHTSVDLRDLIEGEAADFARVTLQALASPLPRTHPTDPMPWLQNTLVKELSESLRGKLEDHPYGSILQDNLTAIDYYCRRWSHAVVQEDTENNGLSTKEREALQGFLQRGLLELVFRVPKKHLTVVTAKTLEALEPMVQELRQANIETAGESPSPTSENGQESTSQGQSRTEPCAELEDNHPASPDPGSTMSTVPDTLESKELVEVSTDLANNEEKTFAQASQRFPKNNESPQMPIDCSSNAVAASLKQLASLAEKRQIAMAKDTADPSTLRQVKPITPSTPPSDPNTTEEATMESEPTDQPQSTDTGATHRLSSVNSQIRHFLDSLTPTARSQLTQSPDILRKLELLNNIKSRTAASPAITPTETSSRQPTPEPISGEGAETNTSLSSLANTLPSKLFSAVVSVASPMSTLASVSASLLDSAPKTTATPLNPPPPFAHSVDKPGPTL
ncbi:hypothetical protein IWQ61_008235 [Dispira simplex]|nr:hypothetical protein IWQ61_008235 [Dispira simplex]